LQPKPSRIFVCIIHPSITDTNYAASLFDLFRQLRDKPTPEVKEKLNKLTMELIVSANTASRTSGSISLAGVINAWNDNREYLRGMYADLVKRMQDPSLQEILEKLLNIHGGIVGLDNLKKWIESLDEHTGKAVKDLEYFRGQSPPPFSVFSQLDLTSRRLLGGD
jgi:hypothetical protein